MVNSGLPMGVRWKLKITENLWQKTVLFSINKKMTTMSKAIRQNGGMDR